MNNRWTERTASGWRRLKPGLARLLAYPGRRPAGTEEVPALLVPQPDEAD